MRLDVYYKQWLFCVGICNLCFYNYVYIINIFVKLEDIVRVILENVFMVVLYKMFDLCVIYKIFFGGVL